MDARDDSYVGLILHKAQNITNNHTGDVTYEEFIYDDINRNFNESSY